MRDYYVYILASQSRVLYIGVTNDLERRLLEHRQKLIPGFTRKYTVTRLVYFEVSGDIRDAITREKQLKGWRREKKIALIESLNPKWDELSEKWRKPDDPSFWLNGGKTSAGADPSTSSG